MQSPVFHSVHSMIQQTQGKALTEKNDNGVDLQTREGKTCSAVVKEKLL